MSSNELLGLFSCSLVLYCHFSPSPCQGDSLNVTVIAVPYSLSLFSPDGFFLLLLQCLALIVSMYVLLKLSFVCSFPRTDSASQTNFVVGVCVALE